LHFESQRRPMTSQLIRRFDELFEMGDSEEPPPPTQLPAPDTHDVF
jgi:hypothetical protein